MSFDFSTLITDRSQADLQAMRDLLSTPMEEWTAEQLAAFNLAASKGAYNYTDLNRVTACMDYLNERLTGLGYQTGYERVQVPHQGGGGSVLPEGYTQLEYIQSSGTQYINTGVKAKPTNLRVTMDFAYTAAHDAASLFGSSTGSNWSVVPYGNPVFYVGTSPSLLQQTTAINTKYALDVSANSGTLTVNLNGSIQTAAYSGNLESATAITLFAHNVAGSVQQICSMRLYQAAMYLDGEKVRDFVPCLNPQNISGLFDLVNGQFYANAGTGIFTAGPEIPPAPEPELPDPYTWYETDDPKISQMMQYLSNLVNLCNVLTLEPKLPEQIVNLTTDGANQIEEALSLLWQTIQQVVNGFARSNCFTFWSGSRPIPCP